MRVAVVGPTHPFKGGVAAHTTELARHLSAAGHETDLISWSHLYPALLYPGEQSVPDGGPDLAPYARTTRPLSWARPDTWVSVGRRLRRYDLVVLVHVVTATIPAQLALLTALRSPALKRGPKQSDRRAARQRVVVVAHNVLPHESHRGAATLVRSLFASADRVVVHSGELADQARRHGARSVTVCALPPHLPARRPVARPEHTGAPRLLALGMVRPYKGVDLLLEALARVPGPTLTVAGELWGSAGDRVRELAARPELAERVDVRDGYVPASSLATLMAAHDVLALPYRSATASQNALLGFAHGLPVLATRTGTFDTDVRDGVDGLLADPGSLESLVQALQRLMEPGVLDQLRAGVRPPDVEGPWAAYLHGVVGQASVADGGATGQTAAPPGGSALEIAKRVAERGLWARVALQRRAEAPMQRAPAPGARVLRGLQRLSLREVPVGVAPTDVLRSRAAWEAAVREARRLRLPLHHDRPKNWDALGAVAAVLQLADDGSRRARVLDAGSARYSPVLPWLRLYGFGDAPESLLGLNLEFGAPVLRDGVTFRYGDITRTGLGDGALDAITCMSVIEHGVPIDGFLAESARVLRPGGILTLSTDFDSDPPDTAGRTAYGVPVRIFGPADIKDLVSMAQGFGLDVVGDLSEPDFFAHAERPVHWQRLGLDYTFVLLTFRRR